MENERTTLTRLKRVLACAMAVLMLFCTVPTSVFAAADLSAEATTEAVDETVIGSGDCGKDGDNVKWTLHDDGTLVISGKGEMRDYGWEDYDGGGDYTVPPYSQDLSGEYVKDGVYLWDGYHYDARVKKVIVEDGVTSIGYYAFDEFFALESVEIADSVKKISQAFSGCRNLTSITLPKDLERISDYAFGSCSSLASIAIPDGVKSIGEEAFYKCSSLTSIVIPGSVTSIGDDAFRDCSSLTSVSLPNGLTELDASYFYGTKLKSLSIPESVKNIESWAFNGMNELENIYVDENNDTYCDIDGVLFSKDKTTLILYPYAKTDKEYTIPEGTAYIDGYAFGSGKLESVVFPETVKTIGDWAFSHCDSLKNVKLPGSLTLIGEGAFSACKSLERIVIPEGIVGLNGTFTDIGYDVFTGCTSLKEVILPDTLVSIGTDAFLGCTSLETIKIPEAVRTIGDNAFRDCASLKSIKLPDGLEILGNNAFGGCSSLESVVIPEKIENISYNVFTDCKNLKNVTLPSTLIGIGTGAFAGCTALNTIDLPEKLEYIGDGAFEGSAVGKLVINNFDCEIYGKKTIPASTEIHGHNYSPAYDYAVENGNKFVALAESKVLDSISIVSLPDKKVYMQGFPFKTDGIVIKLNFADGTSVEKTRGFTVSGFNSEKVGVCTVTLTYADKSVSFDAEIEACKKYDISTDQTINIEVDAGKITYVKFVPEKEGEYSFTSIGENDTCGYLYNENLEEWDYDDNDGEKNNFKFFAWLNEGETYYFGAKYKDSSTTGSFDVKLTAESIECNHANTTEYPEQAATCTASGYTAGTQCNDCKMWIKGHELIEADHKDSDYDGVCDVCKENISAIDSGSCGKNGDNVTWTLYEKGVLVIAGSGEMADYTNYTGNESENLPPYSEKIYDNEHYVDKRVKTLVIKDGVTGIGSYAFMYFTQLESVNFGNVQSIGGSAFRNCSKLTSVILPDSVTNIGGSAFRNCKKLINVEIPDSVTSMGSSAFRNCPKMSSLKISAALIEIGSYAFRNSKCLTEVTIPNGVTKLGAYAFADCDKLSNVSIPNGVTSIGNSAFSDCSSLTSVSIPNSVTSIGMAAFNRCSSLTSITIPNSVTSIGDYAFEDCDNLKSAEIGNGIKDLGYRIFGFCYDLQNVSLADGITEIGSGMFFLCSSLKGIDIPDSVTSIEYSAFKNCDSITSITIPDNVSYIGKSAFASCDKLSKINVEAGNDYYVSIDGVLFNKDKTRIMQYPATSGETSYCIPDNVTSIDPYAFSECSSLTSVVIPNSVTYIGDSAFEYCDSLANIAIPNSVTYIGDSAFEYCDSLTSITIPNSVTYIGWDAFFECDSLKSATILSNEAEIGSYAFGYINGFEEWPDKVKDFTVIGFEGSTAEQYANQNGFDFFTPCDHTHIEESPEQKATCENVGYTAGVFCHDCQRWLSGHQIIKSHIDNNYDNICDFCGKEARTVIDSDCSEDTKWILCDDGLLIISGSRVDSDSFEYDNRIKSVVINEGVKLIECLAFDGCRLESVSLPDSLTSIDSYAFRNNSLESITIPDNVTYIGYDAFSGNPLKTVVIGKGVTDIDSSAFEYCGELSDVYYTGTQEQWNQINIGRNNEPLTCATLHVHVHAARFVQGKPATCTENGYTDGTFCDECGQWASGHTVITKRHTDDNGDKICDICGETAKVVIDCGECGKVKNTVFWTLYEDGELVVFGDGEMAEYLHWVDENYYGHYSTRPYSQELKSNSYDSYDVRVKKLVIEQGVTYISTNAFKSFLGLEEIKIADSVKSIGDNAFENCLELKRVTVPDSVTDIGEYAFRYCCNLVSAKIGNGVTVFDEYMFESCDRLASIEIPGSIKEINWAAFRNCISLRDVYYDGVESQWKQISIDGWNEYLNNATIHYNLDACTHANTTDYPEQSSTCTKEGYTAGMFCNDCQKWILGHEVINKIAHTPAEAVKENEVVATCEAEGSYDEVVYCSVCNTEISRVNKTVAKLSHIPSAWIIDGDASCGTGGTKHKECTLCGATLETEEIPATGEHKYVETTTLPTCTVDGYTTHTCSVCGNSYTDSFVAKLPHTEGTIPGKPATCSETGLTEGKKCSVCGTILAVQEEIAKLDHTPAEAVKENEVSATCSAEGSYDEVVYCSVCQTEISREKKTIAKLDHTPAEAVRENEVAATCTKEGSYDEVVYCSVCNIEISRANKTVAKLPHTEEIIPGKSATCSKTGLTEGKKCSVCDTIITKQEEIAKIPHTPAKAVKVNEVAATCTKEGSYDEVVYCSVCKTEISRVNKTVAKAAHKVVADKAVAATCGVNGKTAGSHCSVCGKVIKTQTVVKATGKHTYGAWKVTKKATYTATGTKTHTCTVCGKTETQSIAKLKTTAITKCTIKLSKTSAAYTGKALKPTVTVKNGKTTLKAGTHYTVTYKNNTKIGKATVTITGIAKNGYSGTKTLTFNIIPANVKNLKATQTTTSVTLSWNKVAGAKGYRVYKYNGKKWIKVADTTKAKLTIKKLKAGTSYKYAVKAYTTVSKTTYWSAAYAQLSTATKPATPTLKATAGKKQAALSWKKVSGASGYVVYMATVKNGGFKKVATIKKGSTVKYTKKSLKKGTTYRFKIMAYKTAGGKNVYSAYSKTISVKAK